MRKVILHFQFIILKILNLVGKKFQKLRFFKYSQNSIFISKKVKIFENCIHYLYHSLCTNYCVTTIENSKFLVPTVSFGITSNLL